jgi:UDP-N-acetylmuramate dehydrogenase
MSRGEILRDALGLGAQDGLAERLELRLDESMARHTTLRLGGPADLWVRPHDESALAELLRRCHRKQTPIRCVGGGTNLLVRDGGIRGVVVNLGKLNRVWRPDEGRQPGRVAVQAGASTGRLLQHATKWELGGVEFLGGVPGSVGGGLIMNAGTYLGEFTNVVAEVRSLDARGQLVSRSHSECGFRYRDSDLPSDEIAVSASLDLQPRPREEIEADVSALRARRKEREPSKVPNNGSTFKNPEGDYAGRLIEATGLKGLRVGGAVVSHKHANWLVVDKESDPACTAADLIALIGQVHARVLEAHGVDLQREVKIIGSQESP